MQRPVNVLFFVPDAAVGGLYPRHPAPKEPRHLERCQRHARSPLSAVPASLLQIPVIGSIATAGLPSARLYGAIQPLIATCSGTNYWNLLAPVNASPGTYCLVPRVPLAHRRSLSPAPGSQHSTVALNARDLFSEPLLAKLSPRRPSLGE